MRIQAPRVLNSTPFDPRLSCSRRRRSTVASWRTCWPSTLGTVRPLYATTVRPLFGSLWERSDRCLDNGQTVVCVDACHRRRGVIEWGNCGNYLKVIGNV